MSETWTPLRVQRLELSRFKAYSGSPESPVVFDFGNADIVLVVGANGRGKTTLIEALELILTGEYLPRVGSDKLDRDPREKFSDFIHDYSSSKGRRDEVQARVKVHWAASPGQPPQVDQVALSAASLSPMGPWCDRRASLGVDARQVRARTLFYAESLGGILGGDPAVRTIISDAFIPAVLPEVQQVISQLEPHLVPALRARRIEVERDRTALTQAAAALAEAAGRLEVAWGMVFAEKPSLRTAAGLCSSPKVNAALKKLWLLLGVEAESLQPVAQVGRLKEVVDRRVAENQEAHVRAAASQGARGADWARVQVAVDELQRLGAVRSEPDQRPDTREELRESSKRLARESADLEKDIGTLREQLARIWAGAEVESPESGRLLSIYVGRLPLLYGLKRPEGSQLLDDLGLSTLGERSADIDDRIAIERARYADLLEQMRTAQARAERLRADGVEADRQLKILEALQRLASAWSAAAGGDALPQGEGGDIDLDEVSQQADAVSGQRGPSTDWPRLSDALARFGEALRQLEQAEQAMPDAQASERALKELARMEAVVESLRGGLRRPSLGDAVRSHLIRRHYQPSYHDAAIAVLGAYAHHERVGKRLQVEFGDDGALHVRVGSQRLGEEPPPGARGSTSALSLSRSQFISVSFALAVAANLGQEAPPLGFICLDDVADALDVDNLAAEATMLRRLAYAEDPRTRRQLIITSHNSELTDRLVPLLVPTPGRKMRIIRIVEKRGDDGAIAVVPEVYNVMSDRQGRGDRSPLRMILRER